MCVSTLPLVIGQAKSNVLYYTIICGLYSSTIFLHIISKDTISNDVREYKMCDFLYSFV